MATDPQILAAFVTVGLTAAAALGGFLFREYRNRVQPFIAVLKVGGDFRTGGSKVDIPPTVVDALKGASYIGRLELNDTLDNVHQAWGEAADFCENGPEALRLMDRVIEATGGNNARELQSSLGRLLTARSAESWITYLLFRDVVMPPQVRTELPVAVNTYASAEFGGCVWLAFPGHAVPFGSDFEKRKLVKQKCQPLIDLIRSRP